jgi:hypothetical protein
LTVYLATPLFGFIGSVAFHDYLLIALVLGSGYLFLVYFTDVEATGRGRLRHLFAAAALLGLATLTKYNGAFLGLAVAATVLTRPRLRPLVLGWPLWVAAALAIAIQTPVVLWNLQEGLASFAYQMGSRHGAVGFTGFIIPAMKDFTVQVLIIVSPFLVPTIIAFFWARQRLVFEQVGKTLAIWTFWLSTLTCLFVSNFSFVLFWWNIVAFVMIMPFSGRYIGPVLIWLHVIWGVLLISLINFNYAVLPIKVLFGAEPGMETERSFDFPRVVAEVTRLKAEYGADFIASNHYIVASQISWELDDPVGVIELWGQRTAYDDWTDFEALAGKSAIFVEELHTEHEVWRSDFEKITPIGEVRSVQFGYLINLYKLYHVEGFRPRR